jgi:hypothetical protein
MEIPFRIIPLNNHQKEVAVRAFPDRNGPIFVNDRFVLRAGNTIRQEEEGDFRVVRSNEIKLGVFQSLSLAPSSLGAMRLNPVPTPTLGQCRLRS